MEACHCQMLSAVGVLYIFPTYNCMCIKKTTKKHFICCICRECIKIFVFRKEGDMLRARPCKLWFLARSAEVDSIFWAVSKQKKLFTSRVLGKQAFSQTICQNTREMAQYTYYREIYINEILAVNTLKLSDWKWQITKDSLWNLSYFDVPHNMLKIFFNIICCGSAIYGLTLITLMPRNMQPAIH